ncbi:MAG: 1-deoxy-D-xylulose-5-phosphate reductoisomerase, partial [Coriobacteriia bacterium]
LGSLDFEPPDSETFGCLALAYEAGRAGGTAPAALNAANEIAVAAFLAGRCVFTDIERTVREVLSAHDTETLESLEQVEHVDARSREAARGVLGL